MQDQMTDEYGMLLRTGLDPAMRMEDGADAGDAEAAAADATADSGADADATGDASATDAGTTDDGPAEVDNDKWDPATRKYIEDLRKGEAKYRTRAQKFETTFSDLDEETTEGLLGLIAALKTGDQAAVPVLESILADLSPKEQEELKESIAEGEEPKALTPEEVEKLLEERDAKKETERLQQEQFQAMKGEIESLGYTIEDDKPNPDTALLFFHLGQQDQTAAPDIKAAHAKVEEYRNGIINGWKESVNQKNSRFARIAAAGATPQGADGGKKPKTREQARAGALEFLANAE